MTGKEAEEALEVAGITVNKNTIPFETRSPFVTSGIRIGVPAVTTKGMKEDDMLRIATFIDHALQNRKAGSAQRYSRRGHSSVQALSFLLQALRS